MEMVNLLRLLGYGQKGKVAMVSSVSSSLYFGLEARIWKW